MFRWALISCLFLIFMFLTGCEESSSSHTPLVPEEDPAFVKILGQPGGGRDVWVHSATDIFALAINGHVARFDGQKWRLIDYLGGYMHNGIWGWSADEVVMVGLNGSIRRFDGNDWNKETSYTKKELFDVWGLEADDVYAVGEGGTILHFNGTDWALQSSRISSDLHGVHGSPDGHVFAVGEDGIVLHKAPGAAWAVLRQESGQTLRGVWAAASDWLVVVGERAGDQPCALFFSADEWTVGESGLEDELGDVYGISQTEIWAVGHEGAFRYDGDVWIPEQSDRWLTGVHAAVDGTLALVQEYTNVHVRTGGDWDVWNAGLGGVLANSIWGASHQDILLVGTPATLRFDGTAWIPQQNIPEGNLHEAWGTSDGGQVFLVGYGSQIFRLVDDALTPHHEVASGAELRCIWGWGDQLFVGGSEGWVSHFDGATWSDVQLPMSDGHQWVRDIDGVGADAVFAAAGTRVFRFDGSDWEPILELDDIWMLDELAVKAANDLHVAGSRDEDPYGYSTVVQHFDGSDWTLILETERYNISELAIDPDGTPVAAASDFFRDNPALLRWNGANWIAELFETVRPVGWDPMWISDQGRLYLGQDGDLWRSREP